MGLAGSTGATTVHHAQMNAPGPVRAVRGRKLAPRSEQSTMLMRAIAAREHTEVGRGSRVTIRGRRTALAGGHGCPPRHVQAVSPPLSDVRTGDGRPGGARCAVR